MRRLCLALLVTALSALGQTWLDTGDRNAVAAAAVPILKPAQQVSMQWTGNMSTGSAGEVGADYRRVILQRINWARRMAGVPPILGFSESYNQAAQAAALLMSANNRISHSPGNSWRFYSPVAAEAAENSNLCLGFAEWDHGCIFNYLEDRGANNTAVAHRRWLLFPPTKKMGTGDVDAGPAWRSANALWVIAAPGQTSQTATRDGFVAWPNKGYFPYQFTPARWSVSIPDADFSRAEVSVSWNGTPISVRTEMLAGGYGDNTLVFIPGDLNPNTPAYPELSASETVVTVGVHNVRLQGRTIDISYQVILFDPLERRS